MSKRPDVIRWAMGTSTLFALVFLLLRPVPADSAAEQAPLKRAVMASPGSTPVSAFPSPGSAVASPSTQIAFRGVRVAELGGITVTGSRSGTHAGRVLGDSDGLGGSFLPAVPFKAREVVTVSTGLNVLGASQGTFRFTIASPAGVVPHAGFPPVARVPGDVLRFHSRPDLTPAAVMVTKSSRLAAPGDIFVGPQQGPLQSGPMILDPGGGLVWFNPRRRGDVATDVRVQSYGGKPVLTWWQGFVGAGIGVGEDVIDDTSYRSTVVRAANGLSSDLHEFEISPQGTALITAYFPVYTDASSVRGAKRQIVFDSVVQELDIPTGLVVFQWDSLDHVPLPDSHAPPPVKAGAPFDYFHVNSVEPDKDGNLVISARNTWAAYKIDHRTGAVIWRLGGKRTSFRLGPGASFAFQHDVRVRANSDLFVTLFDDGAGPPTVHNQSRGLKLILDLKHMTARAVAQRDHTPALLANFEGDFQQLPNHDDFVGWGQQPYFTEYDPNGKLIFDGHFVDANSNYRAYRFPWTATPTTLPAVATSLPRAGTTNVYASWNGATNVSGWRVLAGSSPGTLRSIRAVRKIGFETATSFQGTDPYVAVQALGSNGQTLATSATKRSNTAG